MTLVAIRGSCDSEAIPLFPVFWNTSTCIAIKLAVAMRIRKILAFPLWEFFPLLV